MTESATAPTDRRTVAGSSLTAKQRSQRARLAASARWSRHDGHQGTQAARDAFLARFELQVDPEGRLDPETRAKRAEHAKREHFTRLAMRRHGS